MRKYGILVLSLLIAFACSSAGAATQIKIATLVPKASSWGSKIDAGACGYQGTHRRQGYSESLLRRSAGSRRQS